MLILSEAHSESIHQYDTSENSVAGVKVLLTYVDSGTFSVSNTVDKGFGSRIDCMWEPMNMKTLWTAA